MLIQQVSISSLDEQTKQRLMAAVKHLAQSDGFVIFEGKRFSVQELSAAIFKKNQILFG